MSYGRLFVINVMENAMRLICISNKKCKYRGVDELKFMNDEYLSKNIFIIYIYSLNFVFCDLNSDTK